jgi:pyruvate/oxaloacetate carboxyltransferase
MKSVAFAVKEVREELESEGNPVDIKAKGTICIEDNKNVTIESCMEFAEQLIETGHEGFYLKSASGRVDPEFVRELTAALIEKYPDQDIDIHMHSSYGEAPAAYMAAIEEGVKRDHPIGIDVQHPGMSGSTAHPSMLKMSSLMRNHPDEAIRAMAPEFDMGAIRADEKSLLEFRFLYRDNEAKYNKALLDAMHKARAPGGASSTLRKIPGLEANLGRMLGTNDWDEIQIAIYEMQAEILEDMGDPTQVTPYALMTTNQAWKCLANELSAREKLRVSNPEMSEDDIIEKAKENRWDELHGDAIGYLSGALGKVPESTNPDLIQKALNAREMEKPEVYVSAIDREPTLPLAAEKLKEAGIENPTVRQCISANMILGDMGKEVQHIVDCANDNNKPTEAPELPFYAQTPSNDNRYVRNGVIVRDISDVVQAIGGVETLQLLAERALHLKQIDDDLYIFPEGEECLKTRWRNKNLEKIAEVLDSIPQALEDAGFTKTQVLAFAYKEQAIKACLEDACDAKGLGLFDHMTKALKVRGQELDNNLDAQPDIDDAPQEKLEAVAE